MRKAMWVVGILCLTMLMADMTQAAPWGWGRRQGPDFEKMTDAGINAIESLANMYSQGVAQNAEDVAARIQTLLDAGKADRANALADRTINQINRRSEQAIRAVERSGQTLINLLNRFGETELAAEVQAAVDAAVAQIEQATDDAVAVIDGAFDVDTGEEPAE